jgi:TetR/AcrR family transcriptional regulator, repressor for neighboring sulfatase
MARDRGGLRARRARIRDVRKERRDERREAVGQRLEARKDAREDRREEGDQRRRRRSPEVARQELLDAAERLFARERPDDVGLKDVAREAGTSHALITHYFGTYAGLVESVLQRRLLRLREATFEQLRDASVLGRPDELIAALFRTLGDPVHVRLMKWVLASGQLESPQVFALQQQSVQLIAHQVANTLMGDPAHQSVLLGYEPSAEKLRAELIAEIELSLVTAVAAALGYALTKGALAASIGKTPSPELDAGVQQTLGAMLQAYMREQIAKRTTKRLS